MGNMEQSAIKTNIHDSQSVIRNMRSAQILPSEPCMYRSEDFAGEGYRDPVDVLSYETYELGNEDAVSFMLEHYLMPGTMLYKEGSCYRDMVSEDRLMENVSENDVHRFFASCIARIERACKKQIRFGLWLASKDVVEGLYCGLMDRFSLDTYETKNGIILDDIGYDGMFIGFEHEIYPVRTETVTQR